MAETRTESPCSWLLKERVLPIEAEREGVLKRIFKNDSGNGSAIDSFVFQRKEIPGMIKNEAKICDKYVGKAEKKEKKPRGYMSRIDRSGNPAPSTVLEMDENLLKEWTGDLGYTKTSVIRAVLLDELRRINPGYGTYSPAERSIRKIWYEVIKPLSERLSSLTFTTDDILARKDVTEFTKKYYGMIDDKTKFVQLLDKNITYKEISAEEKIKQLIIDLETYRTTREGRANLELKKLKREKIISPEIKLQDGTTVTNPQSRVEDIATLSDDTTIKISMKPNIPDSVKKIWFDKIATHGINSPGLARLGKTIGLLKKFSEIETAKLKPLEKAVLAKLAYDMALGSKEGTEDFKPTDKDTTVRHLIAGIEREKEKRVDIDVTDISRNLTNIISAFDIGYEDWNMTSAPRRKAQTTNKLNDDTPQVILQIEHGSMFKDIEKLGKFFGWTVIATEGQPSTQHTEVTIKQMQKDRFDFKTGEELLVMAREIDRMKKLPAIYTKDDTDNKEAELERAIAASTVVLLSVADYDYYGQEAIAPAMKRQFNELGVPVCQYRIPWWLPKYIGDKKWSTQIVVPKDPRHKDFEISEEGFSGEKQDIKKSDDWHCRNTFRKTELDNILKGDKYKDKTEKEKYEMLWKNVTERRDAPKCDIPGKGEYRTLQMETARSDGIRAAIIDVLTGDGDMNVPDCLKKVKFINKDNGYIKKWDDIKFDDAMKKIGENYTEYVERLVGATTEGRKMQEIEAAYTDAKRTDTYMKKGVLKGITKNATSDMREKVTPPEEDEIKKHIEETYWNIGDIPNIYTTGRTGMPAQVEEAAMANFIATTPLISPMTIKSTVSLIRPGPERGKTGKTTEVSEN